MSYIYHLLTMAIDFFYRLTGNYGWAIVILSVLFSLLTAPIQHLQLKTTQRTQEFDKLRKEIERRYKDDKKRIQEETIRLMRQEGFNPTAGCLPLIIQMFLVIAFFGALRALKYTGAPSFLWIADLAKPDPWVLPILAGLTTFLRSKVTTPPASDPNMQMQSQMLLYIMPIFVAWMSTKLAAGLSIYWVIANLVSTLQQVVYPAGGRRGRPKPEGAVS